MASVGGGLWPQIVTGPVAGGLTSQAYVKSSATAAAWQSPPGGIPMAPVFQSGQWYDQRPTPAALSAYTVSAPRCVYLPWYLPKPVTIDALAAANSGIAGSVYCGISEYLNAWQPGRLLALTAKLTLTATAGAVIGTITPVTLDAGWYFWSVGNSGGSSAGIYGVSSQIRNVYPLTGPGTVPSLPFLDPPMLTDSTRGQQTDYPGVALTAVSGTVVVPFRIA